MSEWIEHDGKGKPKTLSGNAEVYVEFRDGIGKEWSPERASFWLPSSDDPRDYWVWDGTHNDIVAYCLKNPTT